MAAFSKNVYYDVLDNIVDKYNNTVYRSIKMKPIDVTSYSYAEYNEDSNEKDPKFKFGHRVRISKYKNIFAKGYTQNWSEKVFIVSKYKNTVPWTYVIIDLKWWTNYWKFLQKRTAKTSQEKFRIEKVIKKESDKWHVKWKGYDDSFNSWIDKKDII